MKNICFQMNRKAWLAVIMTLFMALPALAQKVTVTGTVYDSDNEPAIGASVTVQGQSVGAATDIDGNFRISADPNATLVISYVGCRTETVALKGRTNIEVHLKSDTEVLDEFVVVGYGTVKKDDATGSVAVIKPDDIEAGLATSANDLLVGASPGVVVTTDGGNPGGGANILIRGGASLNASNDPLIVVDGVPMYGSYGSANAMTTIAPSNIESFTILKSASATAIYGSRASNGVIIITTKKGSAGKPQVNFSANFHVNTPRNTYEVLDGPLFTKYIEAYKPHAMKYVGNADTDWQKEVLRTSFSHDYDLSVGGTVGGWLPYRVNASYTDNQGIIKTSGMKRTTIGFNLTPKFFNGLLQLQLNAKGSYTIDDNADTGAVGAALSFNPTLAPYTAYNTAGNTGLTYLSGYTSLLNQDGLQETNGTTNPLALLYGVKNQEKIWSSSGNFMVDYALHFLPDLHLNLNLGYEVTQGRSYGTIYPNTPQAWKSNYRDGAGQQSYNYQLERNTMLSFYLNYKKDVEAIKSSFDILAGYDWQRHDYHNRNHYHINTLGYTLDYNAGSNSWTMNEDPSTAEHIGQAWGTSEEQWYKVNYGAGQLNLISFYGRINYSLMDTYLLTFTLRDDGTSRFSKNNRWGLFPALALGWKLTNMPFFEGYTDKMNEFKLRLEWGQTGQQAVGGDNMYTPTYAISKPSVYYPSPLGTGWIAPLYPNSFNGALKWETTTTWNVGVDMAWLNNRVTASVDWYLRDTKDLLAYVPVPAGMTTTNAMNRNIGSLRNIGLEFNIGAKPVVTKDFVWSTGFNVAWNSNKITELTGSADEDKSFVLDAMGNPASENAGAIGVHKVGYPAFSFRVLEQVYDSNGKPIPNCYVDQNGDGEINADDLVIKHSRDPKVTLNWTNNFSYKNWDLGFTLRASIGNYVYNAMRPGRINLVNLEGQGSQLNNMLDSDVYFNDGTAITNLVRSDYFLENAGFLRCDNITLGYTFPNLLNNKLRLRLFGAVQNVFVISKYSGLDPEVFGGVDNNCYPRPITATFGVVANF
ncbi:MAG: TonB-dependent receptor [Muribaculaceae bacterium]|nr:TonB-dependent receptor [Muribaculaceae bacterium]